MGNGYKSLQVSSLTLYTLNLNLGRKVLLLKSITALNHWGF